MKSQMKKRGVSVTLYFSIGTVLLFFVFVFVPMMVVADQIYFWWVTLPRLRVAPFLVTTVLVVVVVVVDVGVVPSFVVFVVPK